MKHIHTWKSNLEDLRVELYRSKVGEIVFRLYDEVYPIINRSTPVLCGKLVCGTSFIGDELVKRVLNGIAASADAEIMPPSFSPEQRHWLGNRGDDVAYELEEMRNISHHL